VSFAKGQQAARDNADESAAARFHRRRGGVGGVVYLGEYPPARSAEIPVPLGCIPAAVAFSRLAGGTFRAGGNRIPGQTWGI
jgi:hypothetical protein